METAGWLKERASHFIEEESFDEAIPFLERLIRLPGAGPYDLCYAHFTLGEIHLKRGHYRLAQENLRDAMDIIGEDARGLMMLGQAYCGDGKFKKGREALEKARRLNPKSEEIELNLGLSMCLKGDFDEAEEVYSRCIHINPDRTEAYVGLAQSLSGQGKFDKSRNVLEAAKDRLPLSLTVRLALRELEHIEEAQEFCHWVFEENLNRLANGASPRERAPIPMIKTVMAEHAFPAQAIRNGEKLWQDFVRVSLVKPRRAEPWAAAAVYAMARLIGRQDITLRLLADRFSVSISVISINFHTITRDLKIVKGDKRYGVDVDQP